ncbi:RUN and FYVE domain-containing protein 4 isoform X2 [Choloepus didactylus]|uniref:RUN and FYVE domain-containing protein 4 isoform X2 n=1 Tax=Choloepus didactylus TaxID=27675 RepID=UPI00189E4F67|nr:RUN and FYVE domain-containing protein 4 isoform X2 [Choloepus didactylus]
MAEERTVLKVTQDLKAAVSAIVQGYSDGQQPVTDASAELHRLCGCLELLLQFDQKEHRSFLRPQKDYWDFLCTALWQQRGDTEPTRFVHSQNKLKTPLGRGRAFIRFCLAHGQLAEFLQLCLLDPQLTREWYGHRSPLVCPELQKDILDSLYALTGVAFDLDLQRPDLDEAWPMFSESHCSNSSRTQGRRPRRTKDSPKKIAAKHGDPKGVQLEEPHTSQAGCQGAALKEVCLEGYAGSQKHRHLPHLLEKKRNNSRSLRPAQSGWETAGEELRQDQEEGSLRNGICLENSTCSIQGQGDRAKRAPKEVTGTEDQRTAERVHKEEAEWGHVQSGVSSPRGMMMEQSGSRWEWEVPSTLGEPWVLQSLGTGVGSTTEKPQEPTGVASEARREEQAEVSLQEVVKSLRRGLWKAQEQAEHQEELLKEQQRELKALQEQLNRYQEEKACLQAELEQKREEAERKDAMYQEELGGQQDLVRAMKRRVLELTQEKDTLWRKAQHLSSVAPRCCVSCNKVFHRLSRRYPCSLPASASQALWRPRLP